MVVVRGSSAQAVAAILALSTRFQVYLTEQTCADRPLRPQVCEGFALCDASKSP